MFQPSCNTDVLLIHAICSICLPSTTYNCSYPVSSLVSVTRIHYVTICLTFFSEIVNSFIIQLIRNTLIREAAGRGSIPGQATRHVILLVVKTWLSTENVSVSFGGDTKSRRSLLSGVYARGSKRSHTGGKCVTCRGLHILT